MIGAQIGVYRVIRQIGEGGMGAVWLAEHVMLGRPVAIKVLHREASVKPELVTRFFNEARAATAISDPGIIQIFDFGHHSDGNAYIVMELLEGEPLDHRLRRLGALPLGTALRILRQVASSLGAAHRRGIVHRDVKPENIFLVRDPEVAGGERTKLLDFGIAKLTADNPMKTRTSAVMGTPIYMSPEQCRGAGQVDQRSDVYALGCVLFTLLTGRPPFDAEGAGDIIAMHLREPPPPPSSVLPGLPAEVDQLVLRCLAKQREQRFDSGAELAVALEALIEELGPLAAVPSTKSATSGGLSVAAPAPPPQLQPSPPRAVPAASPPPSQPLPAPSPLPLLSPSSTPTLTSTVPMPRQPAPGGGHAARLPSHPGGSSPPPSFSPTPITGDELTVPNPPVLSPTPFPVAAPSRPPPPSRLPPGEEPTTPFPLTTTPFPFVAPPIASPPVTLETMSPSAGIPGAPAAFDSFASGRVVPVGMTTLSSSAGLSDAAPRPRRWWMLAVALLAAGGIAATIVASQSAAPSALDADSNVLAGKGEAGAQTPDAALSGAPDKAPDGATQSASSPDSSSAPSPASGASDAGLAPRVDAVDPQLEAERALAATEERFVAVLSAFGPWAAAHEGAPCPTLAALDPALDGPAARDAWDQPLRLTCTEQPRTQRIGVISAGPDRELGTDDDLASWKLPRLAAHTPKGERWGARPAAPKPPPKPDPDRGLPDIPSKPTRPPPSKPKPKPVLIDKDGDGIPDVR